VIDYRREPCHERRELRSNPRLSREAAVGWTQANSRDAVMELRAVLIKHGRLEPGVRLVQRRKK